MRCRRLPTNGHGRLLQRYSCALPFRQVSWLKVTTIRGKVTPELVVVVFGAASHVSIGKVAVKPPIPGLMPRPFWQTTRPRTRTLSTSSNSSQAHPGATLVPEEVFDPAFDRYVDLGLLVQAWDSKDPALLTDVALQLAEGERILLRPHKVISAEKLLGLALRAATERNDKAALDRLKNVAEKTGTESLQAQIAMNAKLGGESRAEDSMAMVSVHETTPLTYAVYHSLVNQIQTARIASDRELLEDTQKQIDAAVGLSEIQRDYLLKIMESAKAEIPEGMKTDPDIEALNKLQRRQSRMVAAGHGHHNTLGHSQDCAERHQYHAT